MRKALKIMSSDSEKDLQASIKFEDYFKPEIYEINEEAELLRQKVKEEQPSELEVRDFAYPSKDPKHWGLKLEVNLEESDISSEDNDSEIDFSSFSQWDNGIYVPFVDIDVEKFFDSVEKAKLIEYAFEKQQKNSENSESHRGSQEFHESDFVKDESRLNLDKLKLKIYNAKSLFDFRKETEWEMSLNEGETLFLIATEDPEEEIDIPEDLKNELKNDMNQNKSEELKKNEVENKKYENNLTSLVSQVENLKTEEANLQSTDRIGSIDDLNNEEDEDDPLTILSKSYDFPHPVDVEIRPHGFYYDLLQYIESSSDYGNGWVLGIKAKIRCRRRFKNKKRLRKKRAIKMKLRIIDIGLIPENYVEVCSDSENEL
ncbi:hypothetical protein BCR36DRAFT_413540 [Piromyces finnis]|uniref:Uncharacterized protein n=1 Tax=Piromyces finnis TaxID=1754191 RepID=A0A1Y1V6H4_9FUNG|nr:hypothetical protein BCR36DRAFT_413540 [Piromyces finnis]|eukprot:ORX47598.1 hypothetical protein BCR36DRAFT_413540 [Piromyces finnis]